MGERFVDIPFEPCLKYEPDFDPKEGDKHMVLVEYNISSTDVQGAVSSKILQYKENIRKFNGSSAEELLYTYDSFNTLCEDMKMNTLKKWSEFPKTLMHGPRKLWKIMMDNGNPQFAKTEEDLKRALSEYLKIYTPDPQAKDTMIANMDKLFQKQLKLE